MNGRRGLAIAVGALVLLATTVLAIRFASGLGAAAVGSPAPRVDASAPEGVRIRVEVLNASEVRGLARRATMYLRDQGFDVVYFGTRRPMLDSTRVVDRSGHPEWARLVSNALGGVPIDSEPDDSRYLDVTVVLGPDWTPPAHPLHP